MRMRRPAWPLVAAVLAGAAAGISGAATAGEVGAYAGQFRVVAGLGDEYDRPRGEILLLSVERMVTPWVGLHGRVYSQWRRNPDDFVQAGMLIGAAYHFRPLRTVDWAVFGELGLAAADAVSSSPDLGPEAVLGLAAELHLTAYHFVQLQYRFAYTSLDDRERNLWALGMGWLF